MSINISWIALPPGVEPPLARLGLRKVGEASDQPRNWCTLGQTPSGWTIIAWDRDHDGYAKALAKLADHPSMITCEMSDVVMVSVACGLERGQTVWSVFHDPEKDPDGVAIEGTPPAELAEITAKLGADVAADTSDDTDHFFTAPVELARRICGYSPEDNPIAVWSLLRSGRPDVDDSNVPSLAAAVREQLMPVARSLGWDAATAHQELAEQPDDFTLIRRAGEFHHRLRINFAATEEFGVWIDAEVWDLRSECRRCLIEIEVRPANRHVPFWRRLFRGQRQFTESIEQPTIEDAIDKAKRDIGVADAFLQGGERGPTLRITHGWARDTWPALPANYD